MNLTMTVKMMLMLFLLCSGFSHFAFASNLRVFRLPESKTEKWEVSLSECNQTHETFVTLYDEEDVNFTEKFVNAKYPNSPKAWLGLRKGRNITWSDGAPVIFNNSSANVTNREQRCEAIVNGTWKDFNCADTKYFMCYKGSDYFLIESEKNWCQALQYCRKHYDNLVSISNDTQNDDVTKNGNNMSFWIGLMHDEWEWMDKGCSTFRKWNDNTPEIKKDGCSQVNYNTNEIFLNPTTCESGTHSFCSKEEEGRYQINICSLSNVTSYPFRICQPKQTTSGRTCNLTFKIQSGIMRIKVINRKLTWEDAFVYCKKYHTGPLRIEDKEDQSAVEQWLNKTNVTGPFWIGLRQSRVFGFWIWSDRTVSYSNWKDDKQPELPMSNHCGAINGPDYKWSDVDCSVPQNFLCEEEIIYMNKAMGG